MPISLKQVAGEAGVSSMAVSMALRDDPRISLARRQQVKRIANRLGYIPNPLARGLRGARTNAIGVLWSLGGPHLSGLVPRELARRLQELRYVSYIGEHFSQINNTLRILGELSQRRVDGIVIDVTPALLADKQVIRVLQAFRAVVMVSQLPLTSYPADVPFDLIEHDRCAALRSMVDHFVNAGRRRPAIVVPASANQYKVEAIVERFAYHGIEMPSKSVVDVLDYDEFEPGQCYVDAVEAAFGDRIDFDCMWCSVDEGAAAMMQRLKEKGVRVPQDVAMAGFNDQTMARYTAPPLATLQRRDVELAALIEQMLLKRMEDPAPPPRREKIGMRFIWRESAGGTAPLA